MIEDLLEKAAEMMWIELGRFDPQDMERFHLQGKKLMHEIAEEPLAAMPVLLATLEHPHEKQLPTAVQILCLIGYPHNAAAIPYFLNFVGDPNFQVWIEVAHALVAIRPDNLAPYLINGLLTRNYSFMWDGGEESWKEVVEGCLYFLSLSWVDKAYALYCYPALNFLFSQEAVVDYLEVTQYFLDIVEKIGTTVDYVLPTLLFLEKKYRGTQKGDRVRQIISLFSEDIIRKYKLVLFK
jgi:hypothetical protein